MEEGLATKTEGGTLGKEGISQHEPIEKEEIIKVDSDIVTPQKEEQNTKAEEKTADQEKKTEDTVNEGSENNISKDSEDQRSKELDQVDISAVNQNTSDLNQSQNTHTSNDEPSNIRAENTREESNNTYNENTPIEHIDTKTVESTNLEAESAHTKTTEQSKREQKPRENKDQSSLLNSISQTNTLNFEKARSDPEAFNLFSFDPLEMSSVTSENSLSFEMKFVDLDFPGVERVQIMDEIRGIYSHNCKSMPHFKEAYLDPNNSVFRDFVDEYIFILRNTFEIPDDHDRFNLLLEEVLSGPVLYHEYKQLMTEEVSHPRFFWGVSSYAELDVNGDGMITTNEIEAKYGKSEKKMTKLKSKERTKDDHISLTEFLNCWDHAGKKAASKQKNKNKNKSKQGEEEDEGRKELESRTLHRKNKAFKHQKKFNSNDFPGVTMEDIADELREAYAANKEVLDNFKEEYTMKDNPLFLDFVDELMFVKRNVARVVPASQEQFSRLLIKLFKRPVEYTEYCYVLSQITVNKFGWGLDSFAKIDLDSNGSISPEEVETAVGQSKKKKERFEALEKNNDGKISLAEFLHCWDHEAGGRQIPYKVMMVLTNNADLGTTGRKTGYSLPELAHPYHVFREAGLDVVFVSPRGGYAPMDPSSYEAYMDDLICANFIEDPQVLHMLDNTLNPANIDPKNISVVFYVGGHGPMWDVAFNREIATIARLVYRDHSGIIGAVSHGTCGLLPITLKASTEPRLLESRKVTAFTNDEQEMMFNDDTWDIMNFKLESKLVEMRAEFSKGEPFTCHVVNHKSVITGQNAQSASKCAEAIVEELVGKIASKDSFNKLL